MVAKIFGLTIAVALALTAALVGGIAVAVGEQVAIGAAAAVLGAAVGVWGIVRIVRLNQQWQDEQRAAVLADPAGIVARWGSGAEETILAERGLVVGRKFHTFAAGFQALSGAQLVGDRTLVLEFYNVGAEATIRREVAVPAAALEAVRGFVARRAQRP